jgi:hypothetical protein
MFLPLCKHNTIPLQTPISYCCVGNKSLFYSTNYTKHKYTTWAKCQVLNVKTHGTYSNHCASAMLTP